MRLLLLAEYQKKSNYGIAIGLLLQIASVPLGDTIISLLVLLAGAGFLIYGCCCYAIGKGHSGGFGLLGILSLLGLIILVLLPDKHK
ncbi:hypothetical protein N9250_01080 [bacterium]|nr:hypothetical protein [bacterium]